MIIEDTEKINNNERLEIEKTEGTIKKVLQEFRKEKTEELKWKLKFATVSRFFKDLSDFEEEKKAREMTRKTMKEIDRFETKIKNIRELMLDTIEHDYGTLICDLNFQKGQ